MLEECHFLLIILEHLTLQVMKLVKNIGTVNLLLLEIRTFPILFFQNMQRLLQYSKKYFIVSVR